MTVTPLRCLYQYQYQYQKIALPCPVLNAPDAITTVVTSHGNIYPSTATYSCGGGYQLQNGVSTRDCIRATNSSTYWALTNVPLCIDINECLTNNGRGPCDARSDCVNTIGSYICTPYPITGSINIISGQLTSGNVHRTDIFTYLHI
jgi:hypothetical protein